MKPRRTLQKGEKIVFESLNGRLFVAIVERQENSMIVIDSYGVGSEDGITYRLENTIHRSQVRKIIRKKEKPLIVWMNMSDYQDLLKGMPRFPPVGEKEIGQDEVPLRPLTDKERKKWGV